MYLPHISSSFYRYLVIVSGLVGVCAIAYSMYFFATQIYVHTQQIDTYTVSGDTYTGTGIDTTLYTGSRVRTFSGYDIWKFTLPTVCIQNPKVSIFMYHYIRDSTSTDDKVLRGLSTPPSVFRSHLDEIVSLRKSWKISTPTIDQYIYIYGEPKMLR